MNKLLFLLLSSIVAHGAVNAMEQLEQFPLHEAAKRGDAAEVQHLLDGGANPNVKGGLWHDTPLHAAARGGNAAVARLLLERGANPNLQNKYGKAPLHDATRWGSEAIVGILLERGADANLQDHHGWTPLHDAAAWGHVAITQLLLEGGANPYLQNRYGLTALDEAVQNNYAAIEQMIKSQNQQTLNREEQLLRAIDQIDMPGILYLLGTGINCNFGLRGTGPLGLATRKGLADVAQLLLERGANPDIKDISGETPLDIAIEHGRRTIIEILLGHGAAIHPHNESALLNCALNPAGGDNSLLRLLASRGVKLWSYKQRLPADINERQDIIRLFAAGEACAICMGNLVDASALHAAPCGHIFCRECFDRWLATQLHEEESEEESEEEEEEKVALCALCKSPL
jgi:cytohesin